MDEFKTLTQSKTFWGAVVGLAGSALAMGHYSLSADDAKSLVDLASGAAAGIGSLIAIWGRIVASKKIGAPS